MMNRIKHLITQRIYYAITSLTCPDERYFEAQEGTHPPLPEAM